MSKMARERNTEKILQFPVSGYAIDMPLMPDKKLRGPVIRGAPPFWGEGGGGRGRLIPRIHCAL
jgi:hypothetical protein